MTEIKVEGLILMRYSHEKPDRMRCTITKIRFGVVAGVNVVAEILEDECPDHDFYSS